MVESLQGDRSDQGGTTMRRAGILRIFVILLVALMLVLGAGCSQDDAAEDSTEAVESTEEIEAPEALEITDDAEDADADAADAADADESQAETKDEPAPAPAPSGPDLGPLDADVSWAYLTDMYQHDGYWYVVVDYIQVVGPEDQIEFVNQNPRLRTFPLGASVNLEVLQSTGSPDYDSVSVAEFHTFQQQPGEEMVQVTPANGYVTQLTQWWSP